MGFKTDDAVWYDFAPGIVISRYPASDHVGYNCMVYWAESGTQSEVWESDLMSDEDFWKSVREYVSEEVREAESAQEGTTGAEGGSEKEPPACKCTGFYHVFGCPVPGQWEAAQKAKSAKVSYSLHDGKLIGQLLYSGPNGDYTVEANPEAKGTKNPIWGCTDNPCRYHGNW